MSLDGDRTTGLDYLQQAPPPACATKRSPAGPLSEHRRPLWRLAVFVLAAACTVPASPPLASSTAAPPRPTESMDLATTPSSAPAPTPTVLACHSQPGEMRSEEYTHPDLARSIPYRVYLPPCHEMDAGGEVPVILLLHGLQLTDSQWDDLGIDEQADEAIRDGTLPPVILVMPWERRGLEFESAIVDHLLPHIRSTFSGGGDRTTTAIGGISRGAGWALRIGLKHADEFGAIGLHSPAVLVPDLYWIPEWIGNAGSDLPALWIDIAERDTSRSGTLELTSLLDELGVPYAWSIAPGEHAATYWSSRMSDYLEWYASPWVPADSSEEANEVVPAGTATAIGP